MSKPKRIQPRPQAYYEAREILAELYGLSPDPEELAPFASELPLPSRFQTAIESNEE